MGQLDLDLHIANDPALAATIPHTVDDETAVRFTLVLQDEALVLVDRDDVVHLNAIHRHGDDRALLGEFRVGSETRITGMG
jgi:hypothetical protein